MKIEVEIDLNSVNTTEELFLKLYQRDLKLQKVVGIKEDPTRCNWTALDDDITCLDYPDEVKEVNVKFVGWSNFKKRLPVVASFFLNLLMESTDITQRLDGRSFTFQAK